MMQLRFRWSGATISSIVIGAITREIKERRVSPLFRLVRSRSGNHAESLLFTCFLAFLFPHSVGQLVTELDANGKCYSRVNCKRGYTATIELPVMEIRTFGNNGHYKYQAVAARDGTAYRR